MQAMRVGTVLSVTARMTRKRDQASQAQKSHVRTPSTTGPSHQSNWNHMPGSGTHGRYSRRRPTRQVFFAAATARRVVRSEPV